MGATDGDDVSPASGRIRQKKPATNRRIECDFCNFKTHWRINMTRHMRTKHSDARDTIHRCQTCSDTFATKQNLDKHQAETCRQRMCSVCGALFKSYFSLKNHMVKHGQAKYHCHTCGKGFRVKAHFQGHLNTHTGLKEKCNTCGASFTYKSNLQRHKKSCGKSRGFMCTECGQQFTSSHVLGDHISGVHEKNNKYKCECGKAFRWRSSLKRHREACRMR